jgi:hypothetical protein
MSLSLPSGLICTGLNQRGSGMFENTTAFSGFSVNDIPNV